MEGDISSVPFNDGMNPLEKPEVSGDSAKPEDNKVQDQKDKIDDSVPSPGDDSLEKRVTKFMATIGKVKGEKGIDFQKIREERGSNTIIGEHRQKTPDAPQSRLKSHTTQNTPEFTSLDDILPNTLDELIEQKEDAGSDVEPTLDKLLSDIDDIASGLAGFDEALNNSLGLGRFTEDDLDIQEFFDDFKIEEEFENNPNINVIDESSQEIGLEDLSNNAKDQFIDQVIDVDIEDVLNDIKNLELEVDVELGLLSLFDDVKEPIPSGVENESESKGPAGGIKVDKKVGPAVSSGEGIEVDDSGNASMHKADEDIGLTLSDSISDETISFLDKDQLQILSRVLPNVNNGQEMFETTLRQLQSISDEPYLKNEIESKISDLIDLIAGVEADFGLDDDVVLSSVVKVEVKAAFESVSLQLDSLNKNSSHFPPFDNIKTVNLDSTVIKSMYGSIGSLSQELQMPTISLINIVFKQSDLIEKLGIEDDVIAILKDQTLDSIAKKDLVVFLLKEELNEALNSSSLKLQKKDGVVTLKKRKSKGFLKNLFKKRLGTSNKSQQAFIYMLNNLDPTSDLDSEFAQMIKDSEWGSAIMKHSSEAKNVSEKFGGDLHVSDFKTSRQAAGKAKSQVKYAMIDLGLIMGDKTLLSDLKDTKFFKKAARDSFSLENNINLAIDALELEDQELNVEGPSLSSDISVPEGIQDPFQQSEDALGELLYKGALAGDKKVKSLINQPDQAFHMDDSGKVSIQKDSGDNERDDIRKARFLISQIRISSMEPGSKEASFLTFKNKPFEYKASTSESAPMTINTMPTFLDQVGKIKKPEIKQEVINEYIRKMSDELAKFPEGDALVGDTPLSQHLNRVIGTLNTIAKIDNTPNESLQFNIIPVCEQGKMISLKLVSKDEFEKLGSDTQELVNRTLKESFFDIGVQEGTNAAFNALKFFHQTESLFEDPDTRNVDSDKIEASSIKVMLERGQDFNQKKVDYLNFLDSMLDVISNPEWSLESKNLLNKLQKDCRQDVKTLKQSVVDIDEQSNALSEKSVKDIIKNKDELSSQASEVTTRSTNMDKTIENALNLIDSKVDIIRDQIKVEQNKTPVDSAALESLLAKKDAWKSIASMMDSASSAGQKILMEGPGLQQQSLEKALELINEIILK